MRNSRVTLANLSAKYHYFIRKYLTNAAKIKPSHALSNSWVINSRPPNLFIWRLSVASKENIQMDIMNENAATENDLSSCLIKVLMILIGAGLLLLFLCGVFVGIEIAGGY